MNQQPLSLDDNECTALMQAAGSIPVELRARFLSALATAIAVTGTHDATAMLSKRCRGPFRPWRPSAPTATVLATARPGRLSELLLQAR
jgi:hypothetical protein